MVRHKVMVDSPAVLNSCEDTPRVVGSVLGPSLHEGHDGAGVDTGKDTKLVKDLENRTG